jgi:arabinose-5-phosphate isomerase
MQCIEEKTYVLQVVKLLLLEADAITKTANRLQSEQVKRVVKLLANCQGKVILVGVGKSGIVARKITATLTGTGTLAVYLHLNLAPTTSTTVALSLGNALAMTLIQRPWHYSYIFGCRR